MVVQCKNEKEKQVGRSTRPSSGPPYGFRFHLFSTPVPLIQSIFGDVGLFLQMNMSSEYTFLYLEITLFLDVKMDQNILLEFIVLKWSTILFSWKWLNADSQTFCLDGSDILCFSVHPGRYESIYGNPQFSLQDKDGFYLDCYKIMQIGYIYGVRELK